MLSFKPLKISLNNITVFKNKNNKNNAVNIITTV